MSPNFWRNKCVLLTGHTGFKGSWLSLWLQKMGAQVHGLALDPITTPNLFSLANVEDGLASHTVGDIRNLEMVSNLMKRVRPEIVIHMAAQPLVGLSYESPVDTYSTNVMGTVNVLESVRLINSVRAVVVVSSDKCYENREWVWGYRENEPMGGFDPYSNSKGCTELITSAYRNSFFQNLNTSVASARAGNVFGGGDWSKDRLIPDILKAIEDRVPVCVRNPNSIRPWQHVLEPLSGYLLLAERLYTEGQEYAEGWNFGPEDNDVKNVIWIVENLIQQLQADVKWEYFSADSHHEATYLKLDISKARQKLNWRPRLRLDRTLLLIADWHRQYLSKKPMKQVCLEQINYFLNQN